MEMKRLLKLYFGNIISMYIILFIRCYMINLWRWILFTIARNLVYKETENRLLSEKLTESLQRQLSDVDSLMEERIDAESLREYINSLIEELPPSRREIFRLSRHEHLSYREIAERLSISEKTVETQLSRALRFLRDRLSSDGFLCLITLFL